MVDWNQFSRKSTADGVLADVDLSGRLVIVTGANAGIGFEAARAMAAAGARVVFACRIDEAGKAAVASPRTARLPSDCGSSAKDGFRASGCLVNG